MKYVGFAFVAATLLIVAWTMATIQPMIPNMVQGAADTLAFVVRACTGTVALIVVAVVVWLLLRQQYERDRQRDGAFALREYHLDPLPKRIVKALFGRPSPKVILDANAMMTQSDGFAKNFIPSTPEVIAGSKLANQHQTLLLQLPALKEGDYPVVCTFPGHWMLMRSVLKVAP